jgi:hypothetical protein
MRELLSQLGSSSQAPIWYYRHTRTRVSQHECVPRQGAYSAEHEARVRDTHVKINVVVAGPFESSSRMVTRAARPAIFTKPN